jgi:phospholipase C
MRNWGDGSVYENARKHNGFPLAHPPPFVKPLTIVRALVGIFAIGGAAFGCSSQAADAIKIPSDAQAKSARAMCAYDAGALPLETQGASAPNGATIPIDTIVVVMMENRSFDHFFEDLPQQGWTDVDVAPTGASNPGVDGAPVPFTHGTGTQLCFADTNHSWDGSHREIDHGKMDGFAVANDGTHEDPMLGPPGFLSGARAMTYYAKDDLPFLYWAASNFAIGDRYFASVPGPTFPNREYLYAGTSFGETTTSLSSLPPSVTSTVLDLLDAKGIAWQAYTDGLPTLDLFASDENSASYTARVADFAQFATDAAAGKLAPVVFLDPNLLTDGYDGDDQHPPAVMQVGEAWLLGIMKNVLKSPQWPHLALFLLWDEHGGLYDHVAPPPACAPDSIAPILTADGGTYGGFDQYGVRVPFVVLSPYAKPHYVSHEVFDHTSVLRFIEARYGLPALTKRDANALAPWDVFDFRSPPHLTPAALPSVPVNQSLIQKCAKIFSGAVATSPYAM